VGLKLVTKLLNVLGVAVFPTKFIRGVKRYHGAARACGTQFTPRPTGDTVVSAMRAKIRSFIESNFYVPEGQPLADDASLLDNGVIDSTGVLELIGFLQDELGVQVADDEMVPANLDSIEKLDAFVQRKLSAAA